MSRANIASFAVGTVKRKRLLGAVCLLLLGFASSSLHAQAPSGSQAPQAADVERFLRAQMEKRGIPGLQVAIVQHGKIVLLAAYGLASVEHSVPVTDRSVFPLNSVTKAFTGVAAMQLVEAGKLKLDAPVSRYLDGLPVAWRAITVRQLFSHTSGLPDIVDDDLKLLDDDDEASSWAKVQTLPLDFAAGDRFKYNHTNYLMLGRIIDKLAGKPFTQLVAERQFDVVGMPSTGYYDARDVVPHIARTYRYVKASDGTKKLNTRYEVWAPSLLTATGINTTAEELARWTIALQHGQLLRTKAGLATLWTPTRLNDGSTSGFSRFINGYAIGWPTAERPQHRALVPTGGARAALAIYPDDDLTVVILTNLLGGSPESFIDEVAGFYIPALRAIQPE